MTNEWNDKLLKSGMKCDSITHSRLKFMGNISGAHRNIVSRLGIGLSLRRGIIDNEWKPTIKEFDRVEQEDKTITIKGDVLFDKKQLPLFNALLFQHQIPENYQEFRAVWIAHWQRGIEELMSLTKTGDWIDTMDALPI